MGADRLFLATLCHAYQEETITEGEGEQQQTKTRTLLKLHPAVAPVKAAIFPLVRKDGMPEKASEIFDELRYDFRLVLRGARRHRQALHPPGPHRHALLHRCGRPDAGGQHRNRAPPRLPRANPHAD